MGDFKFRNVTPGSGNIQLGSLPVQEIFFANEKVWPPAASDIVTICGLTWQRFNTSIVNKIGGGTIPILSNASNLYQASQNQEPAACYFQFDENNSEYGLIYNYYAKNIIEPPSGYRVPTAVDFNVLDSFACTGIPESSSNRYGANPGNWDMSQLTNTDELGDSGFDSQGYGYGYLASAQSMFWLSIGTRAGYWINEALGASVKAKGFLISPSTSQLFSLSYSVGSPFEEMFFIRFVKDA